MDAAAIKSAKITRKGDDWGEPPLWTLAGDDWSIDVHGVDETDARSAAMAALALPVAPTPEERMTLALDSIDPATATIGDVVTALKSALSE